MKLLLCKNVNRLGIVGDVVNVTDGYGRNYLLPMGLATTPTDSNMRALAEARKVAESDMARVRTEMERLSVRLTGVEITIPARANEAGVLYGGVGRREIAHALSAEGYAVQPDQVALTHSIRQLDNTEIEIRLSQDIRATIKLWIVREKSEEELEEEAASAAKAGKEAGEYGGQTQA